MMKLSPLKSAGLLTLMIALTACGQLDRTLEITEEMRQITQNMAQRTAQLQRQSRQAIAQQTRQKSMEIIRQEEAPVEIKLKESGTYFQAFEFQLWENILGEDELIRQNLLAIGAKEFMVSFRGLMNGHYDDADPFEKTGRMPSLLALSGTLEQMNQLQIDASLRPGTGFTAVSMLDLVSQALLSKYAYDHDPYQQFPQYIKEILYFEDEAAYLMELRYNMTASFVLDKLTAQNDLGLFEKLNLLLSAMKISGNWTSKFSRLNSAEISESLNYLNEAMRVRSVLMTYGKKPKLNGKIKSLYERIKIEDDPSAGDRKKQATQDFKAGLKLFMKDV